MVGIKTDAKFSISLPNDAIRLDLHNMTLLLWESLDPMWRMNSVNVPHWLVPSVVHFIQAPGRLFKNADWQALKLLNSCSGMCPKDFGKGAPTTNFLPSINPNCWYCSGCVPLPVVSSRLDTRTGLSACQHWLELQIIDQNPNICTQFKLPAFGTTEPNASHCW
jgi:NAD-dependent dihydropyrimidine dehydrogenase PreA subunit